jgi:hypothetical protein
MSEERVDEGGDGGDADDENADEEQEADDWDDPPGFVLAGEGPEFAEEGEEVFEGAHGGLTS